MEVFTSHIFALITIIEYWFRFGGYFKHNHTWMQKKINLRRQAFFIPRMKESDPRRDKRNYFNPYFVVSPMIIAAAALFHRRLWLPPSSPISSSSEVQCIMQTQTVTVLA